MDTSVSISHFMYPDIEGIPIILDESEGNSFFLDIYHPRKLIDHSINLIKIDGALQLPQSSYTLPMLLPRKMAPDSIDNFSQIHYRKGDYESGELGLALEIEGIDSSYFILQGFRQTPPVIYSSSSWNDDRQNYLMGYKRLSEDSSIEVNVMYHLENFHLPLLSTVASEYHREVESFHGSLNLKKSWKKVFLRKLTFDILTWGAFSNELFLF